MLTYLFSWSYILFSSLLVSYITSLITFLFWLAISCLIFLHNIHRSLSTELTRCCRSPTRWCEQSGPGVSCFCIAHDFVISLMVLYGGRHVAVMLTFAGSESYISWRLLKFQFLIFCFAICLCACSKLFLNGIYFSNGRVIIIIMTYCFKTSFLLFCTIILLKASKV